VTHIRPNPNPVQIPIVKYKVVTFGANRLNNNPTLANNEPTIVIVLQPYLLVKALAIGPKVYLIS
jgi:hypothetical protein